MPWEPRASPRRAIRCRPRRGRPSCRPTPACRAPVARANVLGASQLWREAVTGVAQAYPDVTLEHAYVDYAAMRLVTDSAGIDVLVTENMFGDILSDEAAVLAGSLGLLPSASLGSGPGLFEPVHGSAPPIAGLDVANPIGANATVALLLRPGLNQPGAPPRVD